MQDSFSICRRTPLETFRKIHVKMFPTLISKKQSSYVEVLFYNMFLNGAVHSEITHTMRTVFDCAGNPFLGYNTAISVYPEIDAAVQSSQFCNNMNTTVCVL